MRSIQQWNLNLQREFARNWLVTVGYVGSRGTHIPYLRDFNAPRFINGASTVANRNQRRPLSPFFARFSSFENVASSSYNSLQVSLDKRLSRGVRLLASYTFSKALHEMNGVLTNGGGGQDPDNRAAEWGPADFDRTHALVTSRIWEIPSVAPSRGAAGVLFGGWQANGIWSMYSGSPLQFAAAQDRRLRAHPNRPHRLRDARLPEDRSRADRIVQYFDRAAYGTQPLGEFGSALRAEGQRKGPGDITVTLGLQKTFRIIESHRLQFRAEFFNLFNRPNFGNPGTNIDTLGSFGRL